MKEDKKIITERLVFCLVFVVMIFFVFFLGATASNAPRHSKQKKFYENIQPMPINWAMVDGEIIKFPAEFSFEKMGENKNIVIDKEGKIHYF